MGVVKFDKKRYTIKINPSITLEMDQTVKAGQDYLLDIGDNGNEKADAATYAADIENGRILELGPGNGDALKVIVDSIERTLGERSITSMVVVFDLIHEVLSQVRNNVGEKKVKLAYLRGDGQKRLPFNDGSFDVVNCSAMCHEIFSYCGGHDAVDRIAKELARILKPYGTLTYRDPDGVELHKIEKAEFKTPFSRAFLAYFLPKFLDRKHTAINKVDLEYAETLEISFNGKLITCDALLNLSPQELKEGQISIKAKAGLIHEIQRHLILFGKKFKSDGNDHQLNDEAEFEVRSDEVADKVEAFLVSNGIATSRKDKKLKLSIGALNLLNKKIRELADEDCELETSPETREVLNWGIREGEEHYFYGSVEDVIGNFALHSITKEGVGSTGFSCLCPISLEHIKRVERSKHQAFLDGNFTRSDNGNLKDGKRHIHFAKMPLEKAYLIILEYFKQTQHPKLLMALKTMLCIFSQFRVEEMEEPVVANTTNVNRHSGAEIIPVQNLIQTPHLGLIGAIASGKTTVGNVLAQEGYRIVSLSDFIRERLTLAGINNPKRSDYFDAANQMRSDGGQDVLARLAVSKIALEGTNKFVIDGVRTTEEVNFLRRFVRDFALIAVETPIELRLARVTSRMREIDAQTRNAIIADMQREFFDPSPDGCRLGQVLGLADTTIPGNLSLVGTKQFLTNATLQTI
ncbi:MAG: methyltransferase domain-containing protein [Candidatus Pacebacteria bacterium]|nr:methyltransferase domain-containing protein [Candidatus Paceibacterota bacterium]